MALSQQNTEKFFLQSAEADLVKQVIEITEERYSLANWNKHDIYVTTEEEKVKLAVSIAINRFKYEKIQLQIEDIKSKLDSEEFSNEINDLMVHLNLLIQAKLTIGKALGKAS